MRARRPPRALGLFAAMLAASLACTATEVREQPAERAPEPAPAKADPPSPSWPPDPDDPRAIAGLDGAVLVASYETDTLADLLAALPRPSASASSLVALARGIIGAIADEPSERLALVGLRSGARIHLSARPLDERGPALRKRLGETETETGTETGTTPWPELAAEAHGLGLHIRASLPQTEGGRLVETLARIGATPRASGDPDPSTWAGACAALAERAPELELCAGWPQLLLWAQPATAETLRVDLVYLFHPATSEAERSARDAAILRAGEWPAPGPERIAQYRPPLDGHAIALQLYTAPMLALVQAEALSDAAIELAEPGLDAAARAERLEGYFFRERALDEIVAGQGLFDGLRLDLDYAAEADTLTIELGWLPLISREAELARMFAPVSPAFALPATADTCAGALACGRFGGLASVTRFTELAHGAYADPTGVSRVMRQAGERASILLLLSAWPRLLGTAGALAADGRGLLGQAQSSLIGGSAGLGFAVDSLEGGGSGLAYLRVTPRALDALGPAAALAGLHLESVELAGAERAQRGHYEGYAIYLVDPPEPDPGAWIVLSSGQARVEALLESERDPAAALDPVGELHIESLGPVAGHEQLAYSDDPPIRAWLDGHGLDFALRFGPRGPTIELSLAPSGRKNAAASKNE